MRLWTELPKSLLEWLVIAAILAILVALLLPSSEWASAGTIVVPIRVAVFDIETSLPIADAVVTTVRAAPATGDFALDKYQASFSSALRAIAAGEIRTRTSVDGSVAMNLEAETGASHINPESRAYIRWYWLLVSSKEYGTVAVALRYESMTTASLRQRKFLPAYVGVARPGVQSQ